MSECKRQLESVSPAAAGPCCCCLLARGMQSWTQECTVHHRGGFMSMSFCVKNTVEHGMFLQTVPYTDELEMNYLFFSFKQFRQFSKVVFGQSQTRVGQQLLDLCKWERNVLKGPRAIRVEKSGCSVNRLLKPLLCWYRLSNLSDWNRGLSPCLPRLSKDVSPDHHFSFFS